MKRRATLSTLLSSATGLASALLLLLAGCDAGRGPALGKSRYEYCAPCHGSEGGGNREVGAPAIAGLPQWYVEGQLRKFREGGRGLHPDDVEGLKMRPMARTLVTDDEVKAVAAHVAQLKPLKPEAVLTGDAGRGKVLFATCVACHGEQANGMQDKGAPDLHRTGDWYLLAQLKKFKAGVRGASAGDVTGAQMRPMAMTLADEQAMKDVIAYIKTLQP